MELDVSSAEMTPQKFAELENVKFEVFEDWLLDGMPMQPNGKCNGIVSICWVLGHRESHKANMRKIPFTPAKKVAWGWLMIPPPIEKHTRCEDLAIYMANLQSVDIEVEEALESLKFAQCLYVARQLKRAGKGISASSKRGRL